MPAALALFALVTFAPLTTPGAWEVLAFRGTPPNRVSASGEGLIIDVDRSAGPVVWRLPHPLAVGRLTARGRILGALGTTPARQGQQGADDFALRIGLVEAGTRRPSLIQRRFASEWVRRLFALAPPGEGVAQVRFYNVGLAPDQHGWRRTHPASDLLVEEVVASPDAEGRFALTVDVGRVRTLGVWLSADGDDTGSVFTVQIEHLELAPAAP